jgi:hypothetical protein
VGAHRAGVLGLTEDLKHLLARGDAVLVDQTLSIRLPGRGVGSDTGRNRPEIALG